MKKSWIALAIAASMLAACGDNTPVATVPAAQVQGTPVVVVNQPSSNHDGLLGAAAGFFIGHSLASSSNRATVVAPAAQPTTVINKTTVIKQYVQAPATVSKPAALPSPSVVAPSKVIPAAPSIVKPAIASRLSLSKPSSSSSSSFGGFSRRR